MTDNNLLTNVDKEEYIDKFWDTLEPIIDKQVMRNRSLKTKSTVRNVSNRVEKFTRRYEYTLSNGNKRLVFYIDISPWLWTDGSIKLKVTLGEVKNLVIPKRKIEESAPKIQVYNPNQSNTFWFIKVIEPMNNYLKIIELTPMDVGLFDNVESALRNLIKS